MLGVGQNFKDLEIKFRAYKEENGKWPISFRDLKLNKDSSIVIDHRTGKPCHCLTDKNIYLYYPGESPLKILVMTEVYRTNIWPFGKLQAIVLCASDSRVHEYRYVDPKYVVELTPKEVAELADENN